MFIGKRIIKFVGYLLICSLIVSIHTVPIFSNDDGYVATLDPLKIPKFVNQLVVPPAFEPTVVKDPASGKVVRHDYVIDATEFKQQILPKPLPETKVWGYGGMIKDPRTGKPVYFRNSPGATFEAVKGVPIHVKWVNNLTGPYLYAVDPTLHWANPNMMPMDPAKPWPAFPGGFSQAQSTATLSPHLHGGEVKSIYDGYPEAWFTADGMKGPELASQEFEYPNAQPSATLWYHDHALGVTRINVYSGLAGFYLLRDPNDKLEKSSGGARPVLPSGKYEVPLVIQDRTFNKDGSLFFGSNGINPSVHPYWEPEFFGDTIMVNGKVWPNFNVERKEYRFRVLNGSNARFYNMTLSNQKTFTQIGSDGGYLPAPVKMRSLLLAPGERADILIDFSSYAPGTKIVLKNDAAAPFPEGDRPDPKTVGQIIQFTVSKDGGKAVKPAALPSKINQITKLTPDSPERILTLNEVEGEDGPLTALLNGQRWSASVSETPRVGSTEDWLLVNMTGDTHPIHLHLVQFQLVSRQSFDVDKYTMDWEKLNGTPPLTKPTVKLSVAKYLTGKPKAPALNESGWKDTIRTNPGEVTRIRVRFAPANAKPTSTAPGINLYPFDPTEGPGYVWHCHILDHEDNEMMRPYILKH